MEEFKVGETVEVRVVDWRNYLHTKQMRLYWTTGVIAEIEVWTIIGSDDTVLIYNVKYGAGSNTYVREEDLRHYSHW